MRKRARPPLSSRRRAVETREPRERILIVCEGSKTEKSYFEGLIAYHRLHTVRLAGQPEVRVDVVGAGRVTQSLVEHAGELTRDADYHEVWCVFDRDSFPPDQFDNAIFSAQSRLFHAAWSNEAFELWYLLHFEYLDTSPPGARGAARDHYCKRLTALLKPLGRERYEKYAPGLYALLGDERRGRAIANARRLLDQYPPGTPPSACCPATVVHLLVERLLAFAPEYQPGQQEG